MIFLKRTLDRGGRHRLGESGKNVRLLVGVAVLCLVNCVAGKKVNSTKSVFPSELDSGSTVSIAKSSQSSSNDTISAESSSFSVGTSRQARDYNPGGSSGGGSSYSAGGGSGSHASASSYGAPSVGSGGGGGGGGYGSVAAGGGYPNPQYAIPPIVLVRLMQTFL